MFRVRACLRMQGSLQLRRPARACWSLWAILTVRLSEETRFTEAVRRGMAYRDAGADCVYPMGLVDAASIATFVKALDFPINIMVRKGLPPVSELERLGVARVSFGPSPSYAAIGLLKRAAKEVLEKGTYENLIEGAITFDELNSLATPRQDPKASEA